MRAISFRPLAALAAALSMSVAGMVPAANLSAIRLPPVNIPKPGSRKKTRRMRTGERYPFSSKRQQHRDAGIAAKMRCEPYMNGDMLVRHYPANSGPGMDIAAILRQQRRASDRREAKAMASEFRKMRRKEGSGVVSIDWRIFAKNLKLRRDAEATQAAG